VQELLSPEAVRAAGYFHERAVSHLVKKASSLPLLGERDSMALTGVLSTQLLHAQFVDGEPSRSIAPVAPLKVCLGEQDQAVPVG
jgi:asparagine synthase (glutamine-hydrolysing)